MKTQLTDLFGQAAIGGLLALAFSSATIYLWVTGQVVPGELLVVNTVVVQNYINRNNNQTNVGNVEKVNLAAPSVPEDDKADD